MKHPVPILYRPRPVRPCSRPVRPRSALIVLPALLALLGALAPAPGALAQPQQLIDGIAAQVGGEVVLISDVMNAAAPHEAQARRAGADEQVIAGIRGQVLEREIERALIRQFAQRSEIEVPDAEVDDSIAGIAKQNGISEAQLRASVQERGMPYSAYREMIRGEIVQNMVMNGVVARRVLVTKEEVQGRFHEEFSNQPRGGEEFFLRHILATERDGARSMQEACALVRDARRRVQVGGEQFTQVASRISEANPERGGTLGFLHESELAAWMKPVVLAMQAGDISEVIETPFGCNLLQMVERRSYTQVAFEDVEKDLRAKIFDERMNIEYTRFIEELRANSYIERKRWASADDDEGESEEP